MNRITSLVLVACMLWNISFYSYASSDKVTSASLHQSLEGQQLKKQLVFFGKTLHKQLRSNPRIFKRFLKNLERTKEKISQMTDEEFESKLASKKNILHSTGKLQKQDREMNLFFKELKMSMAKADRDFESEQDDIDTSALDKVLYGLNGISKKEKVSDLLNNFAPNGCEEQWCYNLSDAIFVILMVIIVIILPLAAVAYGIVLILAGTTALGWIVAGAAVLLVTWICVFVLFGSNRVPSHQILIV